MARLKAGLIDYIRQGIVCGLFALVIFSTSGCVEQLLTVDSDPAGAVVYLNDQEIGRTPVTTNFKWYGFYDTNVRKDGYETVKVKSPVIAPWWQWIPFDLFAQILPIHLTDQHFLHYSLKPITERLDDPQRMVRRGERMRAELESGANEPPTRPSKPAASRPATRKPATEGAMPESGPATGNATTGSAPVSPATQPSTVQ